MVFAFDVHGLFSMNALVSIKESCPRLLGAFVTMGVVALLPAGVSFQASVAAGDPIAIVLVLSVPAVFPYITRVLDFRSMVLSLARRQFMASGEEYSGGAPGQYWNEMKVVTDVSTRSVDQAADLSLRLLRRMELLLRCDAEHGFAA